MCPWATAYPRVLATRVNELFFDCPGVLMNRHVLVIIAIGMVGCTAGSPPVGEASSALAPEVVTTDKGDVQGAWDSIYGWWRYQGIPYAEPPLGSLRWKPPADKA